MAIKTKPRVVAIVQARVGSTRLLEKVLRDIEGVTVLERVVTRVEGALSVDDVVVATSRNERDNAIAEICKLAGWNCYRGSEEDVLDRFYQAAMFYRADVVVRINADCPLIDSTVIDRAVEKFLSLSPNVDYVSNVLPRTYPRGMDTEVISIEILRKEWADVAKDREHVTLNIRQNSSRYKIANISNRKDYSYMRWTLDTEEDLRFIRKVYGYFKNGVFFWDDVIELLKLHSDWVIRDTSPILEKSVADG